MLPAEALEPRIDLARKDWDVGAPVQFKAVSPVGRIGKVVWTFGDGSPAEEGGATRKARFSAGDCVVHPILGKGTVTGIDEAHEAYEIKFDRLATPRSVTFKTALSRA